MNNKFHDVGMIKINNFVPQKKIKNILDVLYENILKFKYIDKPKSFEDKRLHRSLIKFRKSEPKKFGAMYDSINLNASLRSVFYLPKFFYIFSKLLGTSKNLIFINGFMLRLDVPFDKRNTLDWHQDSPYYKQTYPKYNSGVCWISLTKNNENNGSLNYIPGSHQKGFVKTSSEKKDEFTSEQFRLKVNTKNSKILKSNCGDASFFHMNVKHKSGVNKSNKVRITAACRFHDMSSNFNIGKELYYYNKSKKITL